MERIGSLGLKVIVYHKGEPRKLLMTQNVLEGDETFHLAENSIKPRKKKKKLKSFRKSLKLNTRPPLHLHVYIRDMLREVEIPRRNSQRRGLTNTDIPKKLRPANLPQAQQSCLEKTFSNLLICL